MAIDTAEKRRSISGIGGGIPGVTPVGSAQDQEWRQESGWSYSGILAGAAIEIARESVVTLFTSLIGVVPTKVRISIRQSEGSGVVKTVAGISQLRATLHARSNLLAADTTILASEDSWLDKFNDDGPSRSATVILSVLNFAGATGAEPVLQFDISALAGLTWKSVKLRLTYNGNDSSGSGNAIVKRILKPVDIATCTWNDYDKSGSPIAWDGAGARGPTDSDDATQVSWPLASGTASGTTILSPDLTDMTNDALSDDAGILSILMFWPGGAHQWHSLEATASADQKPALFFEAF